MPNNYFYVLILSETEKKCLKETLTQAIFGVKFIFIECRKKEDLKKALKNNDPNLALIYVDENNLDNRFLNNLKKITSQCPTVIIGDIEEINTRQLLYENDIKAILPCQMNAEELAYEILLLEPVEYELSIILKTPLNDLITKIPCPAFCLDTNAEIRFANQRAENLLGFEFQPEKTCSFIDMISDHEEANKFAEIMHRSAEMKTPLNVKVSSCATTVSGPMSLWLSKADFQDDDLYIVTMTRYIERTSTFHSFKKISSYEDLPQKSSGNVLLIDNDSTSQILTTCNLEKLNLEVTTSIDLKQASNLLQQNDYNLIIIDELMLNDNPMRTIASLRAFSLCPIIATVSLEENQINFETGILPADSIIIKPFSYNQIFKTISFFLPHIKKEKNCIDAKKNKLKQFRRNLFEISRDNVLPDQIEQKINSVIDHFENLIDNMVLASKTNSPDKLSDIAKELCEMSENPDTSNPVSTIEHMLLSMITARQLEQMQDSVKKIHSLTS